MSTIEDDQRYHCWECFWRRLVCDSTRPVCRRCIMTGIACPGYNEVEPSRLKWLAPGRVVSRTRRPKQPSSDTATHGDMSPESVNGLTPGAGCVAVPLFESQKEGFALFQAVEYFNTCIYQDLIYISELGPNPHIYLISPTHLRSIIPDYLRLGFLCMTLSHRINRARHNPQSKGLIESFFRYRGLAIRSLSEEINIEDRRTSDVIIAGIITLLLLDVQHGASPSWRCHLEGVQRLITLRGGALALAPLKHLESLLLCFVFVAVIGNTTSSASNLAMTGFHIEQLEDIIEQYGTGVFLFQMCPPTLFAEIIRINRVRMQGAEYESAKVEGLSQEADKILSRICAFSAQQWAASKPSSKQDWELLGNVYQAAVTLYCILSLQSLSILPLETSLRVQCATQGKLLWGLLNQALSSPRTRNFMLWPLVLLGVETINYNEAIDETMRSFVEEQLSDLSSYTGSYAPLVARDVLGRFWASGETRWDACFDRPYVFSSQLAVDISWILPQC